MYKFDFLFFLLAIFSVWSANADLTFLEEQETDPTDIRILFESGNQYSTQPTGDPKHM